MELAGALALKLSGSDASSEASASSSSSSGSVSSHHKQQKGEKREQGDRRDAYRRHRKPRPGSSSGSRRHTMSNESARSGSSRGSGSRTSAELNLPLGREFLPLRNDDEEEGETEDVDELRREVLCKLFDLPECTTFYQDFSCAIAASLAMHGRMYPTSSHVCFYSNVFGRERKILIPYESISELDKTTAMVFQSALRIRTTDGKDDYTFTSFWGNSRDSCYDIIAKTRERVVKELRPTVVQSFKRIAGGSPTAQTFNCGDQEETPVPDRTESPTSPAGSRSSVQSVEHEAQAQRGPGENPAEEANANNSSDQAEQAGTPESGPAEATRAEPVNAEETTPNSNDGTTASPPCRPRQRSVVSDINSIAPKDDAMTHILDETFPLSVDDFMSTFFLDNAPFGMDKYGEKTGSTEITVNPWMTPLESEASFGMTRSLQFRVPVEAPIGPKSSRVDVLQCLKTERHVRVVETSTRVVDIPYGDYFSVEDRWTIVPDTENPNQCKVTIELKVVFAKSTFWKSAIEGRAIGDNKAKWKEWVVMAKEFIASQKEAKTALKTSEQSTSTTSSNPPLSREPSSGNDDASHRYKRSKSIGQDRHRSSRGRSSSRALVSVRSRDARVKVFPWILVLVLLFIVVRLQATLSTIESSLELTSRRMLEMQQQLTLIQQSTCPP